MSLVSAVFAPLLSAARFGGRSQAFFVRALCALACVGVVVCAADPAAAKSRRVSVENKKYADIVMDAATGQVLHQTNPDKPLHPASLTKMMTLLLLFDAMEAGQIGTGDRIPVSARAASVVPSKLGLKPGSSIRVEDAIYALVTKSANDVAVAIAEALGGTETRFAGMMTRKAAELGMTRTRFRNASGLHHPGQITTARDMARLARHIIRNRPHYYTYFSTQTFTYKGDIYRNHNRLMETYRGMDGMKTGYIVPSGFNLVASAVRDDRRLIGVVFGGRSASSRNARMAALLDEAFDAPVSKPLLLIASAGVVVPPPLPGPKPSPDDAGEEEVSDEPVVPEEAGEGFGDASTAGDDEPMPTATPVLKPPAPKAFEGLKLPASVVAPAPPVPAPALRGRTNPAGTWSIQVGAYGTREATEGILRHAVAALPADLARVARTEVSTSDGEGGPIFRARLSGYDRNQAIRACRHFRECLVIAPRRG